MATKRTRPNTGFDPRLPPAREPPRIEFPVLAPVVAPVLAPVVAPVLAPVVAPVLAPVLAPVGARVTLPIRFNDIGIDYELTNATKDKMEKYDLITYVEDLDSIFNNLIATRNAHGKKIFQTGSTIEIDGILYTVEKHVGGGAYGAVCKLLDPMGNKYALKEQDSSLPLYMSSDIQFIKEAMINHCIYTIDPTFAPKVHKVFYSERAMKDRLYSLTEVLAVDSHRYVEAIEDQGAAIFSVFSALCPRLQVLNTEYCYTHGDCKLNNTMFDSTDTLRLVDFGMSRMELKDTDANTVVIQTSAEYNSNCNKSHDITLMAVVSTTSFMSGGGIDEPVATFLRNITKGYSATRTKDLAKYIVNTGIVIDEFNGNYTRVKTTAEMYKYCDRRENIRGTFNAILPFLRDSSTIKVGYRVAIVDKPSVLVGLVLNGGARRVAKKLIRKNKTKRIDRKNVRKIKSRKSRISKSRK